jgi:hypothetical protein
LKILINTNEKILKRISKITGVPFETMDTPDTKGAIAVAFQGVNYETDLEKALFLDVPVVAVAGYKDSREYELALESGIPEEAIIVVQGDTLVNGAGIEFTQSTNITAKDIIKICKYIRENSIHPEIYLWKAPKRNEDTVIWEPPKDAEQPTNEDADKEEDTAKGQETIDPQIRIVPYPKPDESTKDTDKQRIIKTPIVEYISRHKKVFAIFKSDSLDNGGNAIKNLAARVNGMHLEMANPPQSFQYYAETKERALEEGCYGYMVDENAIHFNAYKDTLVLEIETNGETFGILEQAMPYITHIIHMTGDFEQGQKDIDSWISMKLPLFGILPIQDRGKYYNKYSSLVKTIDDLVKI